MHRGLGFKAFVAAAVACAGLLLGGAAAMAQDDPPGRVGRIAALQGEVWVYDDEQGEWQSAQRNRPFTQGDRLSTGADGRVAVRIGSTTLQLGGSAELDAVQLDDQHLQFALMRGNLALRVRSDEVAAELEVLTPEGRFVPLRSGLYRIDRQDETSFAGVWRGELQFLAPELARTLQPGQRAEFWREGPQRIARSQWLSPLDDEFALAVQRDDQAETRSAAPVFVSPEMTGAEDLERYGGWQQHPEYGAVWTPATVAVGWVPYRYGHWAWLRPWGWTWVDDAPWGFAPFHYGRWLSWGGRWCWAPGPRVARPVYAPALVAWVGGPQFNVVVGSRPVPAVGWVPLAPREHYRPGYRASTGYLNRLNTYPQQPGLPASGHGNRAVPGAVTVLPATRLAPRQPVAAAALRADEMVLQRQWQAERFQHDAPGRPAYPSRDSARPRTTMPIVAAPTTAGAEAPAAAPPTSRPTRPVPPQAQVPSDATGHLPRAQLPIQPMPQSRPVLPTQPMAPAAPIPPAQPIQPAQPVHAVQPPQPVQPTLPAAAARPMPPVRAPAAQPAQPGTPFGGGAAQAAAPQAGGRPVPPSAQPGATPSARPPAPMATPGGAHAPVAVAPTVAAPHKTVGPAPAAVAPVPVPPAAAPPVAPRTAAPQPPRGEPANPAAAKANDDPGERRRTPESRQHQRER